MPLQFPPTAASNGGGGSTPAFPMYIMRVEADYAAPTEGEWGDVCSVELPDGDYMLFYGVDNDSVEEIDLKLNAANPIVTVVRAWSVQTGASLPNLLAGDVILPNGDGQTMAGGIIRNPVIQDIVLSTKWFVASANIKAGSSFLFIRIGDLPAGGGGPLLP